MLFAFVLLALTTVASPAVVGAEEPGAAAQLTALANAARNDAGLASLPTNAELVGGACVWAQHLADNNSIDHDPNLFASGGGLSSNWTKIGENTGAGGEIVALHETFTAPAGQRSNFTDANFNAIGVCVRSDTTGQLFAVERFAAITSEPAPTATAPIAQPPVANQPAPTAPTQATAPTTAPTLAAPVTTGAPTTTVATPAPSAPTPSSASPTTTSPLPATTTTATIATSTTTTSVVLDDPIPAMPNGTDTPWSAPAPADTTARVVDDGVNIWTVVAGFMSVICAAAGTLLLRGRKGSKAPADTDSS